MGESITIILPWPPRALWPNSRVQHRYSGDKRKAFKNAGFYAAKKAKADPAEHMAITFCPPDRRRRDLDNMLAAIKYGLDGIAAAVGQDDSEWSLSLDRGEPIKGGAVLIEMRGIPE
ncbi:MAG: hypothetical protein ACPG4X_15940 [Pikeienuella sp.]